LGVHSFTDIAGGALIGAVLLCGFCLVDDWLFEFVQQQAWAPLKWTASFALLALTHPRPFPTSSYYTSVIVLGTGAGGLSILNALPQSMFATWPSIMMYDAVRLRIAAALARFALVAVGLVIVKVAGKIIFTHALLRLWRACGLHPFSQLCRRIESLPSLAHYGSIERLTLLRQKNQVDGNLDALPKEDVDLLALLDIRHTLKTVDLDASVKFCNYALLPPAGLLLAHWLLRSGLVW